MKSIQELQYSSEFTIYMNKSIGSIEIHRLCIETATKINYNTILSSRSIQNHISAKLAVTTT